MKRNYSGKKSMQVLASEGEQGFWPSFADVMSSFALILFFLMLIAYLQNLITGQNLVSTQDKLTETESSLAATLLQVEDAETRLTNVSLELEDAEKSIVAQQTMMAEQSATIEEQAASIAAQETAIAEQEATIAAQTTSIEEQEAAIAEQKATIDGQLKQIAEQQEYIALTTEELTKLRTQMQTIAMLRLSVLDRIKTSIEETLGDTSSVSVGDNGSIILKEGLFFDYNSSEVKKESYALLDKLTEAFASFLSNEDNAQYVDTIMISGHTDNTGGAERNRALSAERANAVLGYLLEKNGKILAPYADYFCAAGYGSTRPVGDNKTKAGQEANRRIEISIILKDESVMEIVDAYLRQEFPDALNAEAKAE